MKTPAFVLLIALLVAGPLRAGDEEPRPAEEILGDLSASGYQPRRKAVLAVEGRSEPELLAALLRMARSDPHPNIRGYCAQVIGTFKDERVFPVLSGMIREETSPGPRQDAFVALGRLGDPRGFDLLIVGLASEKTERAYAAKGLGLLADRRGYEPVRELYKRKTNDPYLMDMAPEALLRIDRAEAVDFLLGMFPTVDPAPRASLVRALREHPGPRVRTFMTAMLEAPGEGLRLAAIPVLGRSGDAGTVSRLVPFLDDGRKERGPAADALREIGDPSAAKPIAAALTREKADVTKAVFLRALAALGERRAVAAIIPFLSDEGRTPQPREISSIWGYPYNLHVKAAALCALRTLLDGEPPMPLQDLSIFPLPGRSAWAESGIPGALDWWKAHGGDPRYRFGD